MISLNHKLYPEATKLSSSLASIKNISVLVTAASAILTFSSSAEAISVSLSPSDFSLGAATPSGEIGEATATNAIDEASPTNGFGNAFSDSFLLIGADPTDTDIHTDSINSGNSAAESTTFLVSAADLTNGFTVDFNWAFQGNSTGNTFLSDADNFTVVLLKEDFSTGFSLFGRTADDYGSGSESVLVNSAVAPALTDGSYLLRITLNENSDSSNHSTAAGFNQIVIEDVPPTAVPFEFSPTLGLLLAGGLFGGSSYLKHKKAAKIDI